MRGFVGALSSVFVVGEVVGRSIVAWKCVSGAEKSSQGECLVLFRVLFVCDWGTTPPCSWLLCFRGLFVVILRVCVRWWGAPGALR